MRNNSRTVEKPRRAANYHDRLCDKCHQPMIGVMRVSGDKAPRKICYPCGGKPI